MHRVWLVLLFLSCPTALMADTVTIRADEWYPYNGDPDSDHPGYMIELANTIWGEAGYNVDYRLMPWERALEATRYGNIDCVVGVTPDEAPDFVFPEEPQGSSAPHMYVEKESVWNYQGIESLKDVRLGVIGGYAYDMGELDAYIMEQELSSGRVQVMKGNNALEQNIRKLLSKRIDALAESPSVMVTKLAEMGLTDQIRDAGEIGEPVLIYIGCTPTNPRSYELGRLLSAGIREMRSNGALSTLLGRYGLSDWYSPASGSETDADHSAELPSS